MSCVHTENSLGELAQKKRAEDFSAARGLEHFLTSTSGVIKSISRSLRMKYLWGRRSANAPVQRLSGPWKTEQIGKAEKFRAEIIDHCLDVSIRDAIPKPLRCGDARRNTRR
jgi:hypothetical protein